MTALPELDGPALPPASGGKPRQLVILLHGLRSNGNDLIGLAPAWAPLFPDALFVSPNACEPTPDTPGGYQWFELNSFSQEERYEGSRRAAPVLDGFIDQQMARHGIPASKVVLVGFSQGTMMALHVAPRRPEPIAGVVAYSGMVTNAKALGADLKSRPPVLVVHGDRDPVVPAAQAFGYTVGALEALQFDVEPHIRPGLAHGIDPGGVQLGGRFMQRVLLGR